MGVAIAGSGPKTTILSAAVPKGVKRDIDALARDADLSRSEATTFLLLAGLAILYLCMTSDDAARTLGALGDEKTRKKLAPRVLRKSLELIRAAKQGE